jgi:outer membrane protein assembly factor BamE (lipoprotein component of BamABCDE complex)
VSLAALVLSLGLTLSACESQVSVRGAIPDPEEVAEIQPGLDTKQDILNRFGSPSTVSTFRDNTWYYMGQQVEQFAFYAPDVTDRGILVVVFDDTGVVGDTQYYTLEDGRPVEPVSRVTPTEGKDLTFLQQIFGNFGRLPTQPGSPTQDPF